MVDEDDDDSAIGFRGFMMSTIAIHLFGAASGPFGFLTNLLLEAKFQLLDQNREHVEDLRRAQQHAFLNWATA
jgi:hypothetical protein